MRLSTNPSPAFLAAILEVPDAGAWRQEILIP
jgi:hypothetical protein